MEPASPARLFAPVAGAALLLLGIVGFFYTASFEGLGDYTDALGGLQMNGWLNLFYVAVGAVGLLVAGVSSRTYSLTVGLLFIALAIVGWGTGWLNVTIGVLGLAAAAGTKRGSKVVREPTKEPRKSKPRAQPARQRP
jgi:Domain of unknown function (DUF4383)